VIWDAKSVVEGSCETWQFQDVQIAMRGFIAWHRRAFEAVSQFAEKPLTLHGVKRLLDIMLDHTIPSQRTHRVYVMITLMSSFVYSTIVYSTIVDKFCLTS
jgi:hypothetical protein